MEVECHCCVFVTKAKAKQSMDGWMDVWADIAVPFLNLFLTLRIKQAYFLLCL